MCFIYSQILKTAQKCLVLARRSLTSSSSSCLFLLFLDVSTADLEVPLMGTADDSLHFFTTFPSLSVRYMYYDNCDTPTSWQPTEIVY